MKHLFFQLGILIVIATGACGPPPGAPAPDSALNVESLAVYSLDGRATRWGEVVGREQPTLVVIATLWCDACFKEIPEVTRWARKYRSEVQSMYLFAGSPPSDVREAVAERGIDTELFGVFADTDGRVVDAFHINATPTFLFLEPDGTATRSDTLPAPPTPDLVTVGDVGQELGTSYSAVAVVPAKSEASAQEDLVRARELIRSLESRLSNWLPTSEVSALNRSAPEEITPVSHTLRQILTGALEVSTATAGAFDITWKPLGDLLADAMRAERMPDPALISRTLASVGAHHVEISAKGVRFNNSGTRIGLGGVAKGWIIDAVFHYLRSRGHSRLLVNLGGDLRTSGRDENGNRWMFQILDPYDPNKIYMRLKAEDTAIATSGNTFRGEVVAGHPLGHIIDPTTGYPASFDGSVTVLTEDAAMADALATGLFVMGPDRGLDFVRRTEGVEAVYITREGPRTSLTEGIELFADSK